MFKFRKRKQLAFFQSKILKLENKILELENKLRIDKTGCYTNYVLAELLDEYSVLTVSYLHKYENIKGVIYIDVNNLKRVNDSKGHEYGDKLLREIVDILISNFKLVYRIGGDEFLVLVKQDEVIPNSIKNNNLFSYGYQGITKNNVYKGFDTLVNSAEKAMYRNKAKGIKND